ncbi:hypothetical protein CBW65_04185 [Tumebacillus avium]|uniref:Lantibiotic n=1 Tax=Tumebacillus avium TaxID=1903704 RepID=A0A1Y0IJ64_9BACL|nr:FDLD family class I lanthipeptide [Tumebacillus avium]ARU60350.1 hypothetical protein CBW65_04185 [Tumebacillus avium]
MKHDLFDLDVQVRSVSGLQPDTVIQTLACTQNGCYETVACAPETVDCLQTRINCVSYTCPTL